MEKQDLELYDTMTGEKRTFLPLKDGEVKMYACGPTVYSDPHIGNFRTFIISDILRRWLEYRDYEVFLTMNITDIDDKTIRDSGKKGISLKEFTDKYTKSFLRGVDLLNIKRATVYPRATQYVDEMIGFIEELVDIGAAYEADDGIYFDIDKFQEYGKLSGINIEKVETTERMTQDEYDKESIHDFALWKKSTKKELERGIFYESPWGPGRPGWHIECSAMTRALMGETIDIHLGGEDLIFPHHENEIAQSETLTGENFVRYWVHVRHLMINGGKMSKSLGNYVDFDEVLSNYDSDTLRYFYLSTHYRKPLNYTSEAISAAKNSTEKLENTLHLIESSIKGPDVNLDFGNAEKELLKRVKSLRKQFEASMDDDMNTHGALDALHEMSSEINKYVSGEPNKGVLIRAREVYRELLDVLGLLEKRKKSTDSLGEELIEKIIELRQNLREEENYELADKIRNMLNQMGVEVNDTPEGATWRYK